MDNVPMQSRNIQQRGIQSEYQATILGGGWGMQLMNIN